MNFQLVFIGAPGSGKGTQAHRLKGLGWKHFSTGDALRAEVASGSDIGKKVSSKLASGQLVDDALMLEIIKANCNPRTGQFIFDGYPRNFLQAKSLQEEVFQGAPVGVFYFHMDPSILVSRLTQRRTCSGCGAIWNLISKPPKDPHVCDICGGSLLHREDDREEVIKKRMQVFLEAANPMLDYYRELGVLKEIDASLPEGVVGSAITEALRIWNPKANLNINSDFKRGTV